MDHKAVISNNPDGSSRPIHFQCSCNTAGDFNTEQEAENWIKLVHFPRRGPTDNCELVSVVSSAPASAPTTPSESEAGVENEAHETLGEA